MKPEGERERRMSGYPLYVLAMLGVLVGTCGCMTAMAEAIGARSSADWLMIGGGVAVVVGTIVLACIKFNSGTDGSS